jgi:hypothetical protein
VIYLDLVILKQHARATRWPNILLINMAKSFFEEKDLIKKKCFLAESRKNKTKKYIEKND